MDNIDLEILDLFNRYLVWIKSNSLTDTLDSYNFYTSHIEKVEFSK